MAFCSKCGSQIEDNASACPKCGAPVNGASGEPVAVNSSNDTLMGVLAYLGILALIPYFVKDQSPFVRYHAVRGMNLFILELIAGVACGILTAGLPIIGTILGWLVSIAGLVLSIFGIINVANKEKKDLPVIGGIQFVKE
jgi:uncharacterized membrane protein